MTDEAQIPPADVQTPPPQSGDTATGQASEPVSAPVSEPVPTSESAPAEATSVPEPEQPQPASNQNSGEARQTSQTQAPTTAIRPHGDLALANAKIQATKRKRLDKIMAKLSEKGPTTLKLRRVNAITNDEVEKLLRVSDATATRYLQTLEQENRIKQNGSTGTAVFYEKI